MNREHVKKVAIDLVKTHGLINLSRLTLCKAAGIADGSFPYIMGCTFTEFLDELITEGHNQHAPTSVKKRVNPRVRKEFILNIAIELARGSSYSKVTARQIAEKAGISVGLVTKYFGTMPQLRRDIMRRAISDGVLEIIGQGLASGDKHARKVAPGIKQAAVNLLTES